MQTEELRKAVLKWVDENNDMTCQSKSYGSPRLSSEFCDCSTPFSLDLYNFCSFGCLYCFAFFTKSTNPGMKHELASVNADRIIDMFEGKMPENPYYKNFIQHKKVLHIGGLADNFCNFERKNKVGVKLIEYLLKTGYPTILSTKGDFLSIPEYCELFEKYKDTAKMSIQISIVTINEEKAKQLEVAVVSPKRRLEILKQMHDWGYWSILRLRPFIIGISDENLDEFLEAMNTYNIDAISTEFFCLDLRCGEDAQKRFNFMSELCGFDIVKYYKELSPSTRGTYMRLNRNVKEKYVKKMYEFCKKNNKHFACSDPDFKELNMSGSCCGLPDSWNWCRNQWTNLIINAKKKHDKEGVCYVTIEDLKIEEEEGYKYDKKFISSLISKSTLNSSEASFFTVGNNMDKRWNNPSTQNGIYNYFDGKLKPVRIDKNGFLVYKYVEHPYEKRWKKEGLL